MSDKCVLELLPDKRCEEVIERMIKKSGNPWERKEGAMGVSYEMEDKDTFSEICAEILTVFYKEKEMSSVLKNTEDTLEYYAFLGALISIERDAEKEELRKIFLAENAVNLDGFYHFDLTKMRNAWQGFAQIGARLYQGCEDVDDKVSLILYLLDLDEKKGNGIGVSAKGLTIKNEKAEILPFCADRDKNMLFNIFLYRPETIEVDAGYRSSKKFLDFLRRLSCLTTIL